MSARAWKWVLVIVVVAAALYASYPPVRLPLKKTMVVEKVAQTAEEAAAHKVEQGETYVVDQKEEFSRSLPLVRSEQMAETTLTWREEDRTLVREETTYAEGRIKLGLDMAGGTELLYELKPRKGQAVSGVVGDTIKVLRQRIDPQNVKEFAIQPMGHNRILIQVPQASRAEVERLKSRLVQMGTLEFKLGMPRGDPKYDADYRKAEKGQRIPGYEKVHVDDNSSKPFFLVKEGEAAITGEYLGQVNMTRDERGRMAVGFQFNAQGSRKFASITERNRGWQLAIILDGKLKSAPVIRERIAGAGIIEGEFTSEEVDDLVTVLRAGSLPVDLEMLQESTVGPQLGRDSIARGLRSVILGAFLVFAFMGIYYLVCGLVADGALVLNVVLLGGVMSLMGAALTLPGVAGIVLTIGMAVDANVLIYERIREESAAGKTGLAALRAGYDRAYTVIVDSNVTTVLTALVLYLVGTGPVRGFAVTLSAGLALSMFTALFVTRLTFETLLATGGLRTFKMLSVITRPSLHYMDWRRLGYILSGAGTVVGLVLFVLRGSLLYDVEFTGGTLVRLSLGKAVPAAEVRRRLQEGGFQRAGVQGVQPGTWIAAGASEFLVRVQGVGEQTMRDAMVPSVEGRLKAAGLLEGGEVTVSAGGRGLEVRLGQPVDEMKLREALAGEGGDPFNFAGVSEVVPTDDVQGQNFLLRFPEELPAAQRRDVWVGMIGVLDQAGVEREPCELKLGEVTAGDGGGDAAQMEFQTGRAVQWELLAVELVKLGFPQVTIEEASQPAASFTLHGPRDLLVRFRREAPTILQLPVATIDGSVVTGQLSKPLKEEDLRAFGEAQGLEQLQIVALDARSRGYALTVSYQQIKDKMRTLFSDLGARHLSVEFSEPAQSSAPEPGITRIGMKLSEAIPVPVIQYYLEQAGLKSVARTMEVGEDLDRIVRETNNGRWDNVSVSSVVLRVPVGEEEKAKGLATAAFSQADPVGQVESIGSVVAEEMKGRALLAVILSSVVIIMYMAVRFRALRFGVAAVIALVHDLCITAGAVAIADWTGVMGDLKINLPMLAAFLTVLGYSVNDTIVVFDRIRENMATTARKRVSQELIDDSVNQTLNRTLLTGVTTLLTLVVLYFMGGPVLQGLSFALIVGIIAGTYSSVFVASPLLLDWAYVERGTRGFFWLLFLPVRAPFLLVRALRGKGTKQAPAAR